MKINILLPIIVHQNESTMILFMEPTTNKMYDLSGKEIEININTDNIKNISSSNIPEELINNAFLIKNNLHKKVDENVRNK